MLFLALRLVKEIELCRASGADEFTLFRNFTALIRKYEKEKEE